MGKKKKRASPPAPESPSLRRDLWFAGLAALLTFLLYLPSLWSGFVYDAEAQIQTDNYIHDASHFGEVLSLRVMSRDVLDNNRPVQLLSLMLDSLVWGRSPFGYHLTNNILHSLNVGLLFLLAATCLRLSGPGRPEITVRSAALLAALIFGFHPLNVEPVAEVSSREDVLVTLFILLGLFFARKFAKVGHWWVFLGCVVAFFLAVGTKESGAVAPAILAAYWLIFHRRDNPRRWAILVGVTGLVAVAFLAARFILQPRDSEVFIHPPARLGGSFDQTLLIQPRIWAFLIQSVFWPTHLSADYGPANLAWLTFPLALIGLMVFLLAQGLLGWKSATAAFGALVFWLALGPESNILPMFRPVADRYMYLSLVGFALTIAGGLALLRHRSPGAQAASALGAIVLLALGSQTLQRQKVFANPLALWTDTMAKSPRSSTGANNFAYALLRAGRYQASLEAFQYSLNLPECNKADTWAGAALAFEKLGRPLKAEDALNNAIGNDGRYAHPDKLLKAMSCTTEEAAVFEQILRRLPAQP